MTIHSSNVILGSSPFGFFSSPSPVMEAAEMESRAGLQLLLSGTAYPSSLLAYYHPARNGMMHNLPRVASPDMNRFATSHPLADAGSKPGAEKKKNTRTKTKKSSNKSAGSGERIYIEKIGEFDVLCGRGGRSNNHEGNKRYRQVIHDMKLEYRSTEGKLAKTDLSATIVDHVFGYGGRFIKKDDKVDQYYLLTPKEARRKTSQALRENKECKWML